MRLNEITGYELIGVFRKEKPRHHKVYVYKLEQGGFETEDSLSGIKEKFFAPFSQLKQSLFKQGFTESLDPNSSADPIDTVTLDLPLIIRLLEFAKEDAKDDMALHFVAENLTKLAKVNKQLTMKDYDAIVNDVETTSGE